MILLSLVLPPPCLVDDGMCLCTYTFAKNFGALKSRGSGCKSRPSRTWRRTTATRRCFWQFDPNFVRLVQTLGDVMTVRATGFRVSPSSTTTPAIGGGRGRRHKCQQHWRALTLSNSSATQTQSGVIFTSFLFETMYVVFAVSLRVCRSLVPDFQLSAHVHNTAHGTLGSQSNVDTRLLNHMKCFAFSIVY